MPPKGSKNTASHDTARCSWTDADDVIVMRVLKEQKEGGNQSGAGWKSQVWTLVEAALKSEGIPKGGPKTASKCRVEVVATDMKAATAAAKMVPCRSPFWRVSVADSRERRLWTISVRSRTIIAWKRW